MKCPICKSTIYTESFIAYDDRYGYDREFSLLKCNKCKHSFLDANFSHSQIEELYTKYYPRQTYSVSDYEAHKERIGIVSWLNGINSSAFRWVPHNVKVLDIGCGFCETIGYHLTRGCEVSGVEADENARRVAEKYNYDVKIGLFNPGDFKPSYFDYVTLDQVIEHLQDPIQTLKGIHRVLKPGGRVLISTPNANGWGSKIFKRYWINWHTPYHLHFFSNSSMQLAATKTGFKIKRIQTITSSEWLFYQWIHLFNHPKKGERSSFWDIRQENNLHLKISLKIISIIHKSKINHLTTRIFDSLKIGDNLLFELLKK